MTRFLALSFAVLALAFSACEKHPLRDQTLVTHTHGSNGAPGEAHGHDDAHAASHGEKKDATHAPAAAHAPADEHGKKAEEKPTFFPEKK